MTNFCKKFPFLIMIGVMLATILVTTSTCKGEVVSLEVNDWQPGQFQTQTLEGFDLYYLQGGGNQALFYSGDGDFVFSSTTLIVGDIAEIDNADLFQYTESWTFGMPGQVKLASDGSNYMAIEYANHDYDSIVWNEDLGVYEIMPENIDVILHVQTNGSGDFGEVVFTEDHGLSKEANLYPTVIDGPSLINFDTRLRKDVVVYDLLGRKVLSTQSAGYFMIDMPNGIYWVHVEGFKPQKITVLN